MFSPILSWDQHADPDELHLKALCTGFISQLRGLQFLWSRFTTDRELLFLVGQRRDWVKKGLKLTLFIILSLTIFASINMSFRDRGYLAWRLKLTHIWRSMSRYKFMLTDVAIKMRPSNMLPLICCTSLGLIKYTTEIYSNTSVHPVV